MAAPYLINVVNFSNDLSFLWSAWYGGKYGVNKNSFLDFICKIVFKTDL